MDTVVIGRGCSIRCLGVALIFRLGRGRENTVGDLQNRIGSLSGIDEVRAHWHRLGQSYRAGLVGEQNRKLLGMTEGVGVDLDLLQALHSLFPQ